MAGLVTLANDGSFLTCLSTDVAGFATTYRNGQTLLAVDTGVWYVLYEGTWYAQ